MDSKRSIRSRRNRRSDDDSSKASGGISFECHDSIFFEELSTFADEKIAQEEDHTQVPKEKKSSRSDGIINRVVTTSGIKSSNNSNTSLLSTAEDKPAEEEFFIRRFEKRIIDKHVKTGRLRRVVSSTDALDCRKGNDNGNTQHETRRIRTIASFNNVSLPRDAIIMATHAPNATFEDINNANCPLQGRNEAAISIGRALLGAPSTRNNSHCTTSKSSDSVGTNTTAEETILSQLSLRDT